VIGDEQRIAAEELPPTRFERGRAEGRGLVVAIRFDEDGVGDPLDPQAARGRLQGLLIGDRAEHEMWMGIIRGDEAGSAGFQRGMNCLDRLMGDREICSD
jgi:hypothetical protein